MPGPVSPADNFRSAPVKRRTSTGDGARASSRSRRILGIDPGYDRCGFAVLSCTAQGRDAQVLASGTLRTSRSLSLPQRLHALGQQVAQVLGQWQPDEMAVEQLYYNRNVKTVIEVSQARGVILERAAATGVKVAEYSPTLIKSQITGNGRALKSQVAFMVCRLTGLQQGAKLDDEMDALAVALCHGMRMSIPSSISPLKKTAAGDIARGNVSELVPNSGGTGDIACGNSSKAIPVSIDDLNIYRRDLSHWRLTHSTYWLTWRLHSAHATLPAEGRDIVVSCLQFHDKDWYELLAFVVMDDHVHVIVRPNPEVQLSKITQNWKSVSAHTINKRLGWTGPVWMPESWDRIIRDDDELLEKCVYTLNNPLKRWPEQFGYKWVYCALLPDSVPSSATGDVACATIPNPAVAEKAAGVSPAPVVDP